MRARGDRKRKTENEAASGEGYHRPHCPRRTRKRCSHRKVEESDDIPGFEPHRYLAAPWGMQYLREGPRTSDCIFCSKIAAGDDEANLVLWRGPSMFVMMNLYPYSTGHIMIAPY